MCFWRQRLVCHPKPWVSSALHFHELSMPEAHYQNSMAKTPVLRNGLDTEQMVHIKAVYNAKFIICTRLKNIQILAIGADPSFIVSWSNHHHEANLVFLLVVKVYKWFKEKLKRKGELDFKVLSVVGFLHAQFPISVAVFLAPCKSQDTKIITALT